LHEQLSLGRRTLKRIISILVISSVLQWMGSTTSGSIGVLSDAFHSAFDGLAHITTYIVLTIAFWATNFKPSATTTRRKKWKWFNWLLSQREEFFERTGNWIGAILLFVAAVYTAKESIEHLISPEPIDAAQALCYGCVGLIANIVMMFFLLRAKEAKRKLRVAILHVKGDLIHSLIVVGVLSMVMIIGPHLQVLDPLLGLWLSWKMTKWALGVMTELISEKTYHFRGFTLICPKFTFDRRN
jgi:cobalt-zinc-cadmium efflux system protein